MLNGALVMGGDFLFEPVHFKLLGQRVSGSPCLALELNWGYCIVKALFGKKNIIRVHDFDLVWCNGMRRVMNGYPKMYRVWLKNACQSSVEIMSRCTIGASQALTKV